MDNGSPVAVDDHELVTTPDNLKPWPLAEKEANKP